MSTPDPIAILDADNWDEVHERHPDVVDRLTAGVLRGDPLAQTVIDEMHSDGVRWRDLLHILEAPEDRIGEAPKAFRELLDVASAPPPWYEASLVDAGAKALWRFGSLQQSTLYQSLIYGYQSPAFARSVAATGELTDSTLNRLVRTGQWVAVATAPGLMVPGRRGWSDTVRIRLIHAMVRHFCLTEAGWSVAEWGEPINQTYSALTISGGFLTLPLRVGKDLGIRYSRAELEAIAQLWRWIGWVIGVDEDLLHTNLADAQRLFDVANELNFEPDATSRELTTALFHNGFQVGAGLPAPIAMALNATLKPALATIFESASTRWLPPALAHKAGLTRTPLHHLVDAVRPVVRARELARTAGLLGGDQRVIERELRFTFGSLGLDYDEAMAG